MHNHLEHRAVLAELSCPGPDSPAAHHSAEEFSWRMKEETALRP